LGAAVIVCFLTRFRRRVNKIIFIIKLCLSSCAGGKTFKTNNPHEVENTGTNLPVRLRPKGTTPDKPGQTNLDSSPMQEAKHLKQTTPK